MAKSTKSYEERMLEMEKKEQESLEKAKRYAAQKKELLKRKKAEESKKRTLSGWRCGGIRSRCAYRGRGHPKADWFSEKAGSQWEIFFKGNAERNTYRYGGSVMAGGDEFFIPFIAFS